MKCLPKGTPKVWGPKRSVAVWQFLIGGFNPSEKCESNWIISIFPQVGEKSKRLNFKLPTRLAWCDLAMMGNVMTPGKYYPGTTFAVGGAWSVCARGAKAGPSWQARKHLQKPHNRKPEKSMRFMKNRLQQKGCDWILVLLKILSFDRNAARKFSYR